MKKITRKSGSSFMRDRRGAVAVMVALGMTMLVGVTGMAIDVGSFYMLQIQLQNTADSVALSAVPLAGGNVTELRTRAKAYAEQNMTTAAHGHTLVDNDIIPGRWTGGAFDPAGVPQNAIRVFTRRAQVNSNAAQPYFLSLFGVNAVDIVAEAIATNEANPNCMVALNKTSPKSLIVNSNADVTANGCSVSVNSSASPALEVNSGAILTTESTCVVGTYNHSAGTYSPTPEEGCSKSIDPLAGVILPLTLVGCDETNFSRNGNGTYNLIPCNYHGGLIMNSNTIANLAPGLYVIDGGTFEMNSNTTINGTGITFYLTNDATFKFSSNSVINLRAPTTGPLTGLLIYQDPANNPGGVHKIESNSAAMLEGLIYLPNTRLDIKSNSGLGEDSDYLMILADKYVVDSNATLTLNSDYSSLAGGSPLANLLAVPRLRR